MRSHIAVVAPWPGKNYSTVIVRRIIAVEKLQLPWSVQAFRKRYAQRFVDTAAWINWWCRRRRRRGLLHRTSARVSILGKNDCHCMDKSSFPQYDLPPTDCLE